ASALAATRSAAGEPPLTRDARLDAVARAHAQHMATRRDLAHDAGDGDPDERMRAAGLTARASGENVAHAASVALAQAALWASPSHRANMLRRDFDRLGVAVVRDGRGEVWAVETFASDLRD
ncbi:MAG TPA: CAP domain-containing protein, partial [Acidimicrobiia bacterium]